MGDEWIVAEVSVPCRWLVRQVGDRYIIIWAPFDGEEEIRGSAENLELAKKGAKIFHNDMVERIGSMKNKQSKRERKKKGEVENISCPGQLTIFDSIEQTS